MYRVSKLFIVLVGVICLAYISGCAVVPAGHMGVKTKFGKVQGVAGEGLAWFWPGMQSITVVNCQKQEWHQSCSAASHDLQTVTTDVVLNYYLDASRVDTFYTKYGYVPTTIDDIRTWVYVRKLIIPRIDEVVKSVTAQFKAQELVTQRADVKQKIEEELIARLELFGILVDPGDVNLTEFGFSEAYNVAIEEKQVAEQQREKAQYELEQAEIEAKTKVAEAQGQSEAAHLMAVALSDEVLMKQWIEKWDGQLPDVMSGESSVVYMPGNIQSTQPTQ